MPSQETGNEPKPKKSKKSKTNTPQLKSCLKNETHLNTALNRGTLLKYGEPKYPPKKLSETECLNRLRKHELMAHHHLCRAFRAQGALTPTKLKLLKEVAAALYIPEIRHKVECKMAVNDEELRLIAACVAGPNNDLEWRRQGNDCFSMHSQLYQSLPTSYYTSVVKRLIRNKQLERKKAAKGKKQVKFKTELEEVEEIKQEKEDDSFSSTPTTNIESLGLLGIKVEIKSEGGENESVDIDKALMPPPPPPPIVNIPSVKSPAVSIPSVKPPVVSSTSVKPPVVSTTSAKPPVVSTPSQNPVVSTPSVKPPVVSTPSQHPVVSTLSVKPPVVSTPSAKPSVVSTPSVKPPCAPPVVSISSPPLTVSAPSPPAPLVESDPSPLPVITVPPSSAITTTPPSPSVITVPPSSSIITVPPSASLITVPPSSSIITVLPSPSVITVPPPTCISLIPASNVPLTLPQSLSPTELSTSSSFSVESNFTPMAPSDDVQQAQILSDTDGLQFVSFSEPLDSTLAPLVVVPPEPVITVPHSSSFPTSNTSPTLVLSPGMSIQVRDDTADSRKRKLMHSPSLDSDVESGLNTTKTITLSQISKMTPVVVSTAVTSQIQYKGSPVMSKTMVSVTSQPSFTTTSVTPSAQKVIIVSNSSTTNAPLIQRSLSSMPLECSVEMPMVRTTKSRLQSVQGLGQAMLRQKLMTVSTRGRGKASPLIIPVSVGNNLQMNKTFTVVDANTKKGASGQTPAKILPKPQGPMYKIVNATKGTSTVAGSSTTRIISPKVISAEGVGSSITKPKQNVVILQKGVGSQRALTLTNPSKDLMETLMSKKCVFIESSKAASMKKCVLIQSNKTAVQPPKASLTQSPRPSILQQKKPLPKKVSQKFALPVSTSNQNNVVFLDLSKEQYQKNLNSTTIAEILQASGIFMSSGQATATTSTPPAVTIASDPNWQQISMETGMSLAAEEVSLPLGDSESIVTLEKAVELLGEGDLNAGQELILDEKDILSETSNSQGYQLEIPEPANQNLTISNEELSFIVEKPMTAEANSYDAMTTVPSEADQDMETSTLDCSEQMSFNRDGAVTIQHSSIDMPSNMCLEEYSSQQMGLD